MKYDSATGSEWKRHLSGGQGCVLILVGVRREKSRGQQPASSPASCFISPTRSRAAKSINADFVCSGE
jgi:hypothetical protein